MSRVEEGERYHHPEYGIVEVVDVTVDIDQLLMGAPGAPSATPSVTFAPVEEATTNEDQVTPEWKFTARVATLDE